MKQQNYYRVCIASGLKLACYLRMRTFKGDVNFLEKSQEDLGSYRLIGWTDKLIKLILLSLTAFNS